MLEKISNFLKDHPIAVTILALMGVASGGVTIYVWLFPPSQKPVYNISNVSIITPTLTEKASGLNITYNGETIDNLTISKIGLINLGKEVIKREDIPDKGRFYLQFNDDVKIYDKRIVFTTENANNPSIFKVTNLPEVQKNKENTQNENDILKKYNNRVYLDFDYLAHNEGIIIQIAHSGSSNNNSFDLEGTLPGKIPKFKVMEWIINRKFPHSDIVPIVLNVGIFSFLIVLKGKENKKNKWDIIQISMYIVFVIFFVVLLIVKIKPYIAQFTSKKLVNYHDTFYSDWNLNSKQSNLKSTEEMEEIDEIKFKVKRISYTYNQ